MFGLLVSFYGEKTTLVFLGEKVFLNTYWSYGVSNDFNYSIFLLEVFSKEP